MRVGLISDTHGLLRPEALAALRGSDHIVHAGDIGGPDILDALRLIAPLTVVRGNNDTADWARSIPETCALTLGGASLYVLHDLKQLGIDPVDAGIAVVIAGHSHKPLVRREGSVLYVNPGSAGRRRFSLPVSIAKLVIDESGVDARIVSLFDCMSPAAASMSRAQQ